jgi:hypothetical protein
MQVRAPVAQWIERSRPKAGVGGSNPSGGASSPHQRVLANQTACQASRGRREGESLASGDERLRSMAPGDTARLYHRLSSYAGALTTSGRRRSTIRWYGRTSPPITARRSRPIARSIPTAPGGEAATGAIDVAPAGVDRTSAPSSPQASDRRTAVRSHRLDHAFRLNQRCGQTMNAHGVGRLWRPAWSRARRWQAIARRGRCGPVVPP